MKREAYERQKGICVHCGKHFELEEMEADHITPWKEGGTTVAENCQMLCKNCNRIKEGNNNKVVTKINNNHNFELYVRYATYKR